MVFIITIALTAVIPVILATQEAEIRWTKV
jgi:hypothetical protein